MARVDNLNVARTDCRPLKSSAEGSGNEMFSLMVNLVRFAMWSILPEMALP
jgi:hypothetical protein